MRHKKAGRRLGRNSSHRLALYRSQATSLLRYGRIRTTTPKAKELRSFADKLITLAKRGDLHARRLVLREVQDRAVVKKLFEEIAPRYQERAGGYTRVLRLAETRRGDAAHMSLVELVE